VKNISFTYLLFCLGLLTLLIVSNDNFLSILPIYHGNKFQDLRYIFEYGACLNKISDNNCTFYENHPFVYPQIWLLISKHINVFYGTIFYLLFVFLYLIISIVAFKDINKKYIYHFLFFFSPASVLLIIRANNDIIIFILTYLLIILLKNNKFRVISFTLFIFSYLLKIYSIFLILIYFLKKKNFNIKNYFLLLIFIIFTYFFINEILEINKIYNKSKLVASYSSGIIFDLFNYLNFKIKINTELFSRISLLIVTGLSFSKLNKINYNISKENYLLFISGVIILVTSFFLSRTFDYKLIFILLIIPAIFEIKKKENSYLINIVIFCIFLIIWFEAIIFYYSKYINYDVNKFLYLEEKNIKIIVLGFLIGLKNIFQWIINIFMIFLCKNIVIKNFNK
jgi:hypothetical protein